MDLNTAVNLPADTNISEFAMQITGEILTKYEKPLLYKITEHEFPYTSHGERMEIFNLALSHANGQSSNVMDKVHFERRKALINEQALSYLKENSYIILNGFVNFRLEEYKNELRNLCHEAAEELSTMREYDEFMNMLRFFVSVQIPKEPIIHIAKKDGIMRIFNKRHRDITERYSKEAVFSVEEFTVEDVILSALMTIAPRKIIIHDSRENEKIYDTVASVFSDVEFTTH